MFYKLGKVVSKTKSYLIFESNYCGYIVYAPDIERFEIDKFQKIFIYHHQNEYSNYYYGFKDFKERIFFEDLLSIPGIGPKTAITILNNGWQNALDLVINGDWEKLSEFPYLGKRSARQIVFEYQGKYSNMALKKIESKNINELRKTLKTLGFNEWQVNFALKKIKDSDNLDEMVELAIKEISNEQRSENKNPVLKTE